MSRTPDEIKKGLEMCGVIRGRCKGCPYDGEAECVSSHSADALAYIQQLEMLAKPNEQVRWERDVAIDQLKQLGIGFGEKITAQVPKWISVFDDLPVDENDMLVLLGGEDIYVGWFDGYNGIWHTHSGSERNVTHWMPLPEGPKEG